MTTRSFFLGGNNIAGGISANNTFAASIHGKQTVILVSTSPSYYQYRAAVPFYISNLRIVSAIATTGTGRSITATINEATTALTIALPDGVAALGSTAVDATDIVSVAASDKVGLQAVRGSGSFGYTSSAVITAPGNQAISPMLATGSGVWTTTANRSFSISGGLAIANTAGNDNIAAIRITAPGTFRGLFAYVSTNASTGAAVGTLEASKNGTLSGLKLNVGVGETGYFFENTTTVTVADGDFIDVEASGTTGNSVTITALGATIISNNRAFDIHDYHIRSFTAVNAAAGIYLGITGGDPGATAPSSRLPFMEYVVEFPLKVSRLSGYFVSTLDQSMTVDLLVDGVASGITFQVAAGYTGGTLFDDTNSVSLLTGQKIALRAQPTGTSPTSGSFAWYTHSIRFEDLSPAWKPKVRFYN